MCSLTFIKLYSYGITKCPELGELRFIHIIEELCKTKNIIVKKHPKHFFFTDSNGDGS